ncbi:MAG: hypothetical protein AAGJ50_04460 [Pseudomonadota bacterium]
MVDRFYRYIGRWLESRSIIWTLAAILIVPIIPIFVVVWVLVQLQDILPPTLWFALIGTLLAGIVIWEKNDRGPTGISLKKSASDY